MKRPFLMGFILGMPAGIVLFLTVCAVAGFLQYMHASGRF